MDNRLTLAPAIIEELVDSGGTGSFIINLINNTDQDIILGIKNGYLEKNSSGSYVLKEGTIGDYIPIGWIKGPSAVLLSVGESEEVEFKVRVPKDVISGLYTPTIIFTEQTSKKKDVSVSVELVAQVKLTVDGAEGINKQMEITNFGESGGAFIDPSREFVMEANNISRFDVNPRGSVTVFSPRGVRISTGVTYNDTFKSFLPDQVLSESGTWEYHSNDILEVGNYTAILEIVDANTNEVLDSEQIQFFVFPLQSIVAVLTISLVLFLVGTAYKIQDRSRRKQKVLKKKATRIMR